jgi:SAM-dependent methyltransferase
MNSPEGKSILALVRGGAFAHAGETEAIELALAGIPKDAGRAVLDAGCGLGGTADYVSRHGWGRVTGFDIDAASVELAAAKFSGCTFVASDVGAVGGLWQRSFDLIYCFNTVYAFPDQPKALAQLAETARPGATLVIFEYTDPEYRYQTSAFASREDATFWQPLHPATLEKQAASAGWKLQSFADITGDYLRWYEVLVQRMDARREEVVAGHGETAFAFVHSYYSALRDAIADRTLGGGIFTLIRED